MRDRLFKYMDLIKPHHPRTQSQCNIKVTTVCLPQVPPSTAFIHQLLRITDLRTMPHLTYLRIVSPLLQRNCDLMAVKDEVKGWVYISLYS